MHRVANRAVNPRTLRVDQLIPIPRQQYMYMQSVQLGRLVQTDVTMVLSL